MNVLSKGIKTSKTEHNTLTSLFSCKYQTFMKKNCLPETDNFK